MNTEDKVSAIIVAAGIGKRMGKDISKQYLELNGEPILLHTLRKFDIPEIHEIIVVIKKEDEKIFEESVLNRLDFEIKLAYGGKERVDSVRNGIDLLSEDSNIVLIHDGVRPFIKEEIIRENIKNTKEKGAVITAVASKDTVKIVEDNIVKETPNREKVYNAQTPQSFRKEILINAYENLDELDYITDDSMAVEKLGRKIYIVEGNYDNIKITTEEDLYIGEKLLGRVQN